MALWLPLIRLAAGLDLAGGVSDLGETGSLPGYALMGVDRQLTQLNVTATDVDFPPMLS